MKSPGNTEITDLDDGKLPSHPGCVLVRDVLARVGDKWSVLVIVRLGKRTRRFSELKRSIEGISQRMLTLTLRGLERDGVVERTVYPTVPPRVEYALTSLGVTLLKTVSHLATWAEENRQGIEQARAEFDRREAVADARLRRRLSADPSRCLGQLAQPAPRP